MTDKMGGPTVPTDRAISTLRPLAHGELTLESSGWLGEWQARNVAATIPHVLDHLETGEAYANLARLAGDVDTPWTGMVFTDSDIHKALEAVAWAGATLDPDDDVLARGRRLVDLLARVQEPDGYLNSHVQGVEGVERWSDPQWGHELYCAGHLVQAGVAAGRTGALPGLLDVATRFADLLVATFGPGTPTYVEGHPELETALVELYRATGVEQYLGLARNQVEARGHGWLGEDRFGSAYFQDHAPVRSAPAATGHAVRQLYLLAGAVDVAVETGDVELLDAARATWSDLFATKTYVTGAHGSRHRDEAIGDPYELPADRAYAETCAAIASFQLAWRLLLATGEVRYAHVMENVLYNAIAGSTAADGRAFFYSNPLHLRTDHHATEDAPSERLDWYTCACCPPNIARLLASVHDYLVTTSGDGLQIQHYTAGRVSTAVRDGRVTVDVATEYPYDGRVTLTVRSDVATAWELALRVPEWSRQVAVVVDGFPVDVEPDHGYVRIVRDWSDATHTIELTVAMPVRCISAHPRVDAVRGCIAVARGPLLYAVEDADLPAGVVLEDLRFRDVLAPADVTSTDAVVELEMERRPASDLPLYGEGGRRPVAEVIVVRAVPYHRWGNRGPGAMRVWLPTVV